MIYFDLTYETYSLVPHVDETTQFFLQNFGRGKFPIIIPVHSIDIPLTLPWQPSSNSAMARCQSQKGQRAYLVLFCQDVINCHVGIIYQDVSKIWDLHNPLNIVDFRIGLEING